MRPQAGEGASGVLPLPGVSSGFALRVNPATHARAGWHAGCSTFDPGRSRWGLPVGGEQRVSIGCVREEQAVLRLVAGVGMSEQAVGAQLAFTLTRRRRHAAAGHVGESSGGRGGPVGVAEDGQRPGGLGPHRRRHAEVLAAALSCPQAGLQSTLPALQRLHKILQLCFRARAPQQRPPHRATAAVLHLHTVCREERVDRA